MHLLVANGAVLETGAAQIVKRWRHCAESRLSGKRRRGQVGVAFQAKLGDMGTIQHPRVRAAMRLMAGAAAFELHRSVLEREGTYFIAVALGAARFGGARRLNAARKGAAVRVMAIAAGHRVFRE